MTDIEKFIIDAASQCLPSTVKFRAVNYLGEIIYFDIKSLPFDTRGVYCINDTGIVDKKTMGQFVGQEDAYHNDIYSGDIVKAWNSQTMTYDVGVVIWHSVAARFVVWIPYQGMSAYRSFEKECNGLIVIGDIHRHKYLLENLPWMCKSE